MGSAIASEDPNRGHETICRVLRHGLGAIDSVTFKPEEAERPDWPQMATDPKITRCDSHRFVYRLPVGADRKLSHL